VDEVESPDGRSVAVHDLGGRTVSLGDPIVLLCHATGFHGRSYLPMAEALGDRFHSFAPDFGGHGETAQPPPAPDGHVDWAGYGDEALAVARSIAPEDGVVASGHSMGEVVGSGHSMGGVVGSGNSMGGVVGFGHSMGGAALLMAAAADPDLFDLLVLYEPVVYPPPEERPRRHGPDSLATGARRRRARFDSVEAAYAHYASKPPLNAFEPAALWAYVTFGFEPDPDDPSVVRLRCDPEHEARTFEQGGEHDTWARLPNVAVPVVVVRGRVEESSPSAVADAVAERLPGGRLVALEQLDHFGPMTHPRVVAELVTHWIDQLVPGRTAVADGTPRPERSRTV